MQRFFDVLISGFFLLALLPFFMLIAIILRLTGEGEVFFLQERVGKDGKLFKLYKFATMLKNSPNTGTGTVTLRCDPRVLPLGKFLRKTKINELPQLLNIFLGDMSVVGPRPQTQQCFMSFSKDLQLIIVKARPGLSGIGSIVFRDEENILGNHPSSVEFYHSWVMPYKGIVETWYVDHQNLFTYFTLILITVWVILFPSSKIVWRIFTNLPMPPDELQGPLNYKGYLL